MAEVVQIGLRMLGKLLGVMRVSDLDAMILKGLLESGLVIVQVRDGCDGSSALWEVELKAQPVTRRHLEPGIKQVVSNPQGAFGAGVYVDPRGCAWVATRSG